jgi:FixJ family two-component response regulator
MENLQIMTRIGLVDDDPSVRRAVSRLLRSHGYECVAYESAETALADPDLPNLDCLVLDIELLGMDGFDLRDRLRDRGARIPHVFLTAHSESDYRDWATRMGDSSYLTKPVEEEQLLSSIERLIAR